MKPIGIKGYYSGGRRFSTENSSPHSWPLTGALMFMVYYPNFEPEGFPGRTNVCGGDWFIITPDLEVFASDWRDDGTWVPKPIAKEGEIVVQGEYVSDEEYNQVREEATGDRLWP